MHGHGDHGPRSLFAFCAHWAATRAVRSLLEATLVALATSATVSLLYVMEALFWRACSAATARIY